MRSNRRPRPKRRFGIALARWSTNSPKRIHKARNCCWFEPGALAALLQGEEGRDVAQFDSRREALDEARQVLRVACDQLRKLQADVAAAIKRQPRGVPPTQGQLSTAQLLSLEMHVRHELARGLTNQGLCYPATAPIVSIR